MSDPVIEPICTCNDETQTKERTCMNCKKVSTHRKEYHERVAGCAVHRNRIAICGPLLKGAICNACEAEGYYLRATGSFPSAHYEVKRQEKQ